MGVLRQVGALICDSTQAVFFANNIKIHKVQFLGMVGSEGGSTTDEAGSAASGSGSSVTTTNENTNENKQENKNENTNSNSGRKRRDVVGSSKAFCNFSISSNFLVIFLAPDPQVHMILSYAV